MKKLILQILLLFCASVVIGQVGLKAGFNSARITAGDTGSIKGRVGFQGGIMFRKKMNFRWDIKPEILYSLKGAKYYIQGANADLKFGYLDVPVAFIYKSRRYPKITAHFGPQFSYLLRTDATYVEDIMGEDVIVAEFKKENFENFDLGIFGGIGFHINDFLLEFRYTRHFVPYNKESNAGTIDIDETSTHQNAALSLGYYF